MDKDKKQIISLLLAGSFFLSLPFLMKTGANNIQNSKPLNSIKTVKKPKIKKTKRAPANSLYSVEDFKAKNLLNKKMLTKEQYNDALKASKHVGISYEPHVDSGNKLTESDVVATRKIEAEMRAYRENFK